MSTWVWINTWMLKLSLCGLEGRFLFALEVTVLTRSILVGNSYSIANLSANSMGR